MSHNKNTIFLNIENVKVALTSEKYLESEIARNCSNIQRWVVKTIKSKISSDYFKLCLTEKFYIIESLLNKYLLNKTSELVSKCRYQNKFFIKLFKKMIVWTDI